MVPLLREEGFYEHEEPRKIYWPEYSDAQIKDAKETLEFIRDKVDECVYLKFWQRQFLCANFLILPREKQKDGWI